MKDAQEKSSQPVAPQPAPAVNAPPYQPQPQYVQAVENPGQTMGIIGLVLNFFAINIGGIILGVVSRNQSKAAGMPTTLGTISLVWGIIGTVGGVLVVGAFFLLMLIGALAS